MDSLRALLGAAVIVHPYLDAAASKATKQARASIDHRCPGGGHGTLWKAVLTAGSITFVV
jgi:hypothetical protein